MNANPVVWFEIYVKDMTRAVNFYETLFQCQLRPMTETADFEMRGFPGEMPRSGASGALVRMKGFDPAKNSTIVYFGCNDCGIEEKRATSAGGRVQKTKTSIGEYGFISLIIDTEGNIIGLHSMK